VYITGGDSDEATGGDIVLAPGNTGVASVGAINLDGIIQFRDTLGLDFKVVTCSALPSAAGIPATYGYIVLDLEMTLSTDTCLATLDPGLVDGQILSVVTSGSVASSYLKINLNLGGTVAVCLGKGLTPYTGSVVVMWLASSSSWHPLSSINEIPC
jgi:hypothetical protein